MRIAPVRQGGGGGGQEEDEEEEEEDDDAEDATPPAAARAALRTFSMYLPPATVLPPVLALLVGGNFLSPGLCHLSGCYSRSKNPRFLSQPRTT